MGLIVCPETSVRNYHSTLRNIPEEQRSRLPRPQKSEITQGNDKVQSTMRDL
jgi:hypothetical protein